MSYKIKVKELVNNPAIFDKLNIYVQLIEEKNQVMNLTGFSGDTLWEQGIYESLILMQNAINHTNLKQGKILDIGAGAGFPSLPFIIWTNNNFQFTIYEPIAKRVNFLNLVKQELNLENLEIVQIRSEQSPKKEHFDLVTARAVSRLSNLIQAAHHLAKIGGYFCFIKGPNVENEVNDALEYLQEFHLKDQIKIMEIKQDKLNKQNFLVFIDKNIKTPTNYPKKWSQIINKQNLHKKIKNNL
ncbi:16S rRNA (guanine(527)-N(7))-methyltransferase RsmG [Mycoplasma iguanae]|uniref:Ribosomal RNA small subunit methyltransferase G n=1 Tax=Mycoplasma iguanae TaxID=292461 RepID=A0ABY5R8Z0_9MOLU|nr:16S rRNA (guanine(527)-N(7))-methyltransferase RsmG [Mycoplasma iguanae]UVD81914.1 16S rRNA (guanine(527)-N(7))-methyltransferase RsmG [Mycoplasma iguanae]